MLLFSFDRIDSIVQRMFFDVNATLYYPYLNIKPLSSFKISDIIVSTINILLLLIWQAQIHSLYLNNISFYQKAFHFIGIRKR